MKPTELMIGDYVLYNGEVFRIKEIGEGLVRIVNSKGQELICEFDEIEPIPLTPEILEKNGFEKDEFSLFMYPLIDGVVRFDEHQYGLYCNILRPFSRYDAVCNYFHQLQHAFKLCGIDKEIEP